MQNSGANPILTMNNGIEYQMVNSAGTSGTVKMMIGGSTASANFDFHEMMFFSGTLNDNDDIAVKDYFMTKYSLQALDYLNFLGDSITVGSVTTDPITQGFAGLTAYEKNKPQNNFAISGTGVYHVLTGSDMVSRLKNIKYYPGNGWLIICFGTNDTMDSNWVNTYVAQINRLIRLGWPKSKIILMTPQYQPSLSGGSTMHTNVLSVATAIPGILLADYWAVTQVSDPTGSTLADGKHPNVTGHRNWATWFETNFIQN
jgi:lysophospholipase L1-like esterase